MINAEGGINGRKINFISYDDAYSPPKAIEQARKLVDDLTRENVMKQAANLKNFTSDMLLPGGTINTSPDDTSRSNRCS
jgi:ABC-type branched-subunit amino acid transport system substrate-binding protein